MQSVGSRRLVKGATWRGSLELGRSLYILAFIVFVCPKLINHSASHVHHSASQCITCASQCITCASQCIIALMWLIADLCYDLDPLFVEALLGALFEHPGKTKRCFWANFYLFSTYFLPMVPHPLFFRTHVNGICLFLPKIVPHPCYKLKHGTHLLFFLPHVYGFCLFSTYIPLIFRLFST